jgi:hypothetical protein
MNWLLPVPLCWVGAAYRTRKEGRSDHSRGGQQEPLQQIAASEEQGKYEGKDAANGTRCGIDHILLFRSLGSFHKFLKSHYYYPPCFFI